LRVRIVAERRAGASWPQIAAALNEDGIPAARGGVWGWSSVRAAHASAQLDGVLAA
jgi:hypothetical protein